MPTSFAVTGLHAASLDHAFGGGDVYRVNAADLDPEAVEQIAVQWAEEFRAHCKALREASSASAS